MVAGMEESVSDNVNHPKHYNSHPSGVECIAITEHFNFNIGNAIKYLWRAGLKGREGSHLAVKGWEGTHSGHEKHLEDLKKAAWYINREIERLQIVVGVDYAANGDHGAIVTARARSDGSMEIIDCFTHKRQGGHGKGPEA